MSSEAITGSLTGLLEGGVISIELMEDAETGERLICMTVETGGGTEVEVAVHADEAVELATDLLMFAQDCRRHNEGGEEA